MSKDGKTEKATPQRRRQARKEGQVINSKELKNLMVFLALFIGVIFMQPVIANSFFKIFTVGIETINLGGEPKDIVVRMLLTSIPLIGVTMALVIFFIIVNYGMQVGFLFSIEAVKPSPKRINPANYWKNIANVKKTGFELAKNIFVFFIIVFVIYTVFSSNIPRMQGVLLTDWLDAINLFSELFKEFVFKLGLIFLALGIIDYVFQKMQYENNLKMKKEEVKDEMKDDQGDPMIKGQQRQMRMKLMEKQVKKKVSESQMIIVNPTHYSVAIRYKRKKDAVPRVLIKGVDEMALVIRRIAKENKIPIIENKTVARKIYGEIEEGEYINEELFEVVGKIIAELLKDEKINLD